MTSSSAPTASAATGESAPALRIQDRIGAGLQALRYPAFVLAITAGFLAATGASAIGAALADLVYRLSGGDALVQGVLYWISATPFVIVPLLGGVLADRLDRRVVWLCTAAAQTVLALLLAVAEQDEAAPVLLVFAVSFAFSIAAAMATPVQQAIVANLVPARALGSAVGLVWASYGLGAVVGPLAAVPLKSAGGTAAVCLFLAAAMFAATLCILALRRFVATPAPPPETTSSRGAGLREALAYAVGKPVVMPVVALTAVVACCGFSVVALLSVFAYSVLGLTFSGYSTFLIVLSLGSILGGVAASFTGRRSGPRMAAVQLACVAVALGVFAFSLDPHLSYVAIALVAFVSVWLVTSLEVVLQYTVDDEHRGRVMAAFLVVRSGLIPFGALALGALAEATSPQSAVATYALIALASAAAFSLWALRSGSVRSWPRPGQSAA